MDQELILIVKDYLKFRLKVWRNTSNKSGSEYIFYRKKLQDLKGKYGLLFLEAVRKDYVKTLHQKAIEGYQKHLDYSRSE